MAQQIAPLVYRDWSAGLNDSVCNYLLPDNYSRRLINCYTDESNGNELGNIKGRKGQTILGNQIEAGKDVLGLHNFIDKTGTPTRLVATVNNLGDLTASTRYLNGSSWDEIGTVPTGWAASTKMRFETFLDMVFAANGTDAIMSWNGTPTTNWLFTNATNAPRGSMIKNFQDRLNIAGVAANPSRVFYSSVPDVAGTGITWEDEYVDVNPDDNDFITALEVNAGIMLVFKKRSVYVWDGLSTQVDKIIDIGCVSQEAVQTVKGITIFFGETKGSAGIFMYTGQYPQEISRDIRKWIDAISSSNYDTISSFQEEDAVIFSVGTLTYESESFINVQLRYCISKQSWSVNTTPDRIMRGITYIDSSSNRTIVVGDNDGQVLTWNSGFTDNSSIIESIFRTKEQEFGS